MKSAGHVRNAVANFVITQFTSTALRTLNIFELCVTGDEVVFDEMKFQAGAFMDS